MTGLRVTCMFVVLFNLAPLVAWAQVQNIILPSPIIVSGTRVEVNTGAGGQIDPHVSADWASYADNSVYHIRFQNIDVGITSDRLIPRPDGMDDSLSDISGNQIVFTRVGSGIHAIYSSGIDALDPIGAQEVAPLTDSLRRRPTVGAGTIAFEDRSYDPSSSAQPEVTLYDGRLGSVVVGVKCASTTAACHVWQATRANRGVAEQLTGRAGEPDSSESLPDTNGMTVVYGSGVSGEQEESNAAVGTQFDLFVYDLSTGYFYKVTDTPVSETLSDVSIALRDWSAWSGQSPNKPTRMTCWQFVDCEHPPTTPGAARSRACCRSLSVRGPSRAGQPVNAVLIHPSDARQICSWEAGDAG